MEEVRIVFSRETIIKAIVQHIRFIVNLTLKVLYNHCRLQLLDEL